LTPSTWPTTCEATAPVSTEPSARGNKENKRIPVTNGSTLLSKQALELVPSIINRVLEEDQLFVGIVAVDRDGILSTSAEQQRKLCMLTTSDGFHHEFRIMDT